MSTEQRSYRIGCFDLNLAGDKTGRAIYPSTLNNIILSLCNKYIGFSILNSAK